MPNHHATAFALALTAWALPTSAQRPSTVVAPAGLNAEADLAADGDTVHFINHTPTAGPDPIDVWSSHDRGATWTAGHTLEKSGLATFNPYIVADQGTVIAIWSANTELRTSRSMDSGRTWSAPVSISTPGTFAISGGLALSGSLACAAWLGDDGTFASCSQDAGATWSAPTKLGPLPRPDDLRVAIVAARACVLWQSDSLGLLASTTADAGANWTGPTRIRSGLTPSVPSSNPRTRLFVDSATEAGVVYAAWAHATTGGGEDLFYARSTDVGLTWSVPVRLSSNVSARRLRPRLAVDGSTVCLAWLDNGNGSLSEFEVMVRRSTDGGATWGSVLVMPSSEGRSADFGPGLSAVGPRLVLSWFGNLGFFTARSADAGATWSPPLRHRDTLLSHGAAASGRGHYVVGYSPFAHRLVLPFAVLAYGAASPGSGGIAPALDVAGVPLFGGSVSADLSQALGGSQAALLLGTQQATTPILGATLLVQPLAATPLPLSGPVGVPGAGAGSLPFLLPNDPALAGQALFLQAVTLDPGAPAGVAASQGIELWIG